MLSAVEWIWFISLMILTGYHQVIFRRKPDVTFKPMQEWPGVSIIIAHKNQAASLLKNLLSISEQDYPVFEIIVIDNGSDADQLAMLIEGLPGALSKMKFLVSPGGKKEAITLGVQHAQYGKILCTDADCIPLSNQWIKHMASKSRVNDMILGYSPYRKKPGWLNSFIRFETVITAIQYMSWSMAGRPYMGVGRNMMYSREMFLRYQPYRDHTIPYGDDDLLVQQFSNHVQARICANPEAHVVSEPEINWKAWFNQKHRHLSAGHHYKGSRLWQPGVYGVCLVLHWVLLPILILYAPFWKWFLVFCIGFGIRWWTYSRWTRILKEKDTILKYPLLEINYALYLGIAGLYTWFKKKRTWK